jgi:hypothetical protein
LDWSGDPEDLLVTTSGDAAVDADNEWVIEALNDPRYREHLRVLIDHRETRWWAMSNEDVRRRAALIIGNDSRVGAHRVAFVAGSPVDYGIGRMLKGEIEGRVQLQSEIFEDIDKGRAWLRFDPMPTD